MNKSFMRYKKGFTLIELLVVIAIIALLLSIIMPALNKVKMHAEMVICKSNLHQYHLATEMYTSEQDERFPSAWKSLYNKDLYPGEVERYCRWHNPDYNIEAHPEYAGPYWPYLAVTKANICPTFEKIAPKYGPTHMAGNGSGGNPCIGGPFEPQFSYSMNGMLSEIKKSQLASSPAQTFMWAEENMWVLTYPSAADSAKKVLSRFVLNDNALCADGRDCFASYHKISAGQLSIQRSTNKYNDAGVGNVLLLDGSLVVLPPTESIDYAGRRR